jgi:hypothetical protein
MGMSLCFRAGEKIVALSGTSEDGYDLRYHSQPCSRMALALPAMPCPSEEAGIAVIGVFIISRK